jgi:thymidylate synthase
VANGELSCQVYQRSCDLGLGLPFNIASYALLTKMIAHVCNLRPGDLIMSLGNAHVYKTHVEALNKQIERKPYAFPKLIITTRRDDIDSFEMDDFTMIGYKSHDAIKMPMAV